MANCDIVNCKMYKNACAGAGCKMLVPKHMPDPVEGVRIGP